MYVGRVCATDKSLEDNLVLLMEGNTIGSNTTVDFGVGEDVTGMFYVLKRCAEHVAIIVYIIIASLFFSISCTSVWVHIIYGI